jgi:hypothetical protein
MRRRKILGMAIEGMKYAALAGALLVAWWIWGTQLRPEFLQAIETSPSRPASEEPLDDLFRR